MAKYNNDKIIQQLEYKTEEQGIIVIKQEESHSSKCSFFDNEPIEHHAKYLGQRITRGLFKSKEGTIINTDVNGAYNILKKAFLNAIGADRIEDVRVTSHTMETSFGDELVDDLM